MSNITQITGDIKGHVVFDVNTIVEPSHKSETSNNKWIKTNIVIIYIFLVLSIILSVAAILRTFTKDLSFDWSGIVVGALSLIVAVLIGWQIYNIIKVEQLKEQIEATNKNIGEIKSNAQIELYKVNAQSLLLHAKNYINEYNSKNTDCSSLKFAYGITAFALYYHTSAQETNLIDSCLDILKTCLKCAEATNEWKTLFDDTTEQQAQKCYLSILTFSRLLTSEQLSVLNAINQSRRDKSLSKILK